ncbi:MAG: hypothetical protein WBS20_02425 [Lysobacterales bacterium]
MVACRDDAGDWSFYLLNDNDFSLIEVVLYQVSYEWGDCGSSESSDIHINHLLPGGHVRVWRDDGDGVELRMEFCFRIPHVGRTLDMRFEFPKLYRKKDLPLVNGLDRPGWEAFGKASVLE